MQWQKGNLIFKRRALGSCWFCIKSLASGLPFWYGIQTSGTWPVPFLPRRRARPQPIARALTPLLQVFVSKPQLQQRTYFRRGRNVPETTRQEDPVVDTCPSVRVCRPGRDGWLWHSCNRGRLHLLCSGTTFGDVFLRRFNFLPHATSHVFTVHVVVRFFRHDWIRS